jgi:hypothetical protein
MTPSDCSLPGDEAAIKPNAPPTVTVVSTSIKSRLLTLLKSRKFLIIAGIVCIAIVAVVIIACALTVWQTPSPPTGPTVQLPVYPITSQRPIDVLLPPETSLQEDEPEPGSFVRVNSRMQVNSRSACIHNTDAQLSKFKLAGRGNMTAVKQFLQLAALRSKCIANTLYPSTRHIAAHLVHDTFQFMHSDT